MTSWFLLNMLYRRKNTILYSFYFCCSNFRIKFFRWLSFSLCQRRWIKLKIQPDRQDKISIKICNSNCRKYFDEILALRSISGNSSVICYRVLAILLNIMCSLADLTQQQRQHIHIPNTALSIKNLLDQNIYSTVTIQQIADSFSYDKAHIIREFEKHYHQTPYQYLLSQKILIAKKLLLGTNVSITNISEQLGFKSVFYFSRLFKKKVGLSPREYRIQSIES